MLKRGFTLNKRSSPIFVFCDVKIVKFSRNPKTMYICEVIKVKRCDCSAFRRQKPSLRFDFFRLMPTSPSCFLPMVEREKREFYFKV